MSKINEEVKEPTTLRFRVPVFKEALVNRSVGGGAMVRVFFNQKHHLLQFN